MLGINVGIVFWLAQGTQRAQISRVIVVCSHPGVIPAHPLASFHAGCHGNRSVESPWLAIKQYLQRVVAIDVGIYIYFVINLVIRTALVCGDIL
jgi:hypothetical protein